MILIPDSESFFELLTPKMTDSCCESFLKGLVENTSNKGKGRTLNRFTFTLRRYILSASLSEQVPSMTLKWGSELERSVVYH
jgi:hypothetical protein